MRRSIRGKEVMPEGVTYADGNCRRYYYYRTKGKKYPLGPGPIDSPEFLRALAAAKDAASGTKAPRRAREGSVAALCAAYKASATYLGHSVTYRAMLARHIDQLCADSAKAAAPFAALEPKHIRADLQSLAGHAGRDRLKLWKALASFALEAGLIDTMCTDGVRRPRVAKSDGHAPWSRADVEAYRARWPIGTVQRLCLELVFWTGARTVDAVTLSPAMVGRDGVLTFRQSKTGDKAHVPWSSNLPPWAGADFAEDWHHLTACLPRGTFTFLEATGGKARSVKGLSNVISAGAKAAGLEGRSAHGLRKARLIAIAEAGGSAHAIMAWGGHQDLTQAQHYVSAADRKRLVAGREQTGKGANTPFRGANTKGKM